MSIGFIYRDAAEYIRKHEFAVNVPVFYEPFASDAILLQNKTPRAKVNPYRPVAVRQRSNAPFRHIIDPMQLQYACYSIQVMIDMCQKKVEFIILNDPDIPLILDAVDRYLVYLRGDVERGNEEIITFAKKVVKFRELIYKHYFRFMKLNPAALEGIYPNGNSKVNILSLLSVGCRKENLQMDPLAARELPPYDIDAITPKATPVDANGEESFTSAYGISSNGASKDDGKDFDFNGFLGLRKK